MKMIDIQGVFIVGRSFFLPTIMYGILLYFKRVTPDVDAIGDSFPLLSEKYNNNDHVIRSSERVEFLKQMQTYVKRNVYLLTYLLQQYNRRPLNHSTFRELKETKRRKDRVSYMILKFHVTF